MILDKLLNYIVFYFSSIIVTTTIVIFFIKFLLFIKYKSPNEPWLFMLYYPSLIISITKNPSKKKVRKYQNLLSNIVFILMTIAAIAYFVAKRKFF